jgi:hypothetical protein
MRMHLPCNPFAPEMHADILGSAHGAAQLHRECTVRHNAHASSAHPECNLGGIKQRQVMIVTL